MFISGRGNVKGHAHGGRVHRSSTRKRPNHNNSRSLVPVGGHSIASYGNVKCKCENSGGQIDLDTNSSGHHSWVSGICKRLCPNNTTTMIY